MSSRKVFSASVGERKTKDVHIISTAPESAARTPSRSRPCCRDPRRAARDSASTSRLRRCLEPATPLVTTSTSTCSRILASSLSSQPLYCAVKTSRATKLEKSSAETMALVVSAKKVLERSHGTLEFLYELGRHLRILVRLDHTEEPTERLPTQQALYRSKES